MTLSNTPQPLDRDDDYSPAAIDADQADELAVADPLTGQPLPTTPPTETQALAEQSALDVPVGQPVDSDELRAHRAFAHDQVLHAMVDEQTAPTTPTPGSEQELLYLLDGLYVCTRDSSAWAHGTMSLEDFEPAEQDEDVQQNFRDWAAARIRHTFPADLRERVHSIVFQQSYPALTGGGVDDVVDKLMPLFAGIRDQVEELRALVAEPGTYRDGLSTWEVLELAGDTLEAARRPAPSLTQALGDPGSYTKRLRRTVDGVIEYERIIDWQERAVRIAMGEQDIDQ